MTNAKTLLLSTLLLGSLLPVQLCAAHPLPQPPAAAPEAAAFKFPDTPAGLKLSLLFKALESGARAPLIDFLKAHYPKVSAEDQANQILQIREQSGGMTPLSVDPRSTPTAIAVKVKSRNSGTEYLYLLAVESAAPNNVAAIGMANAGYPIEPFMAQKR